ncbi:MAG TPA: 3-dehydroquinate synthase [Kiritimatiellia bacterium]|nr:3-dehydroquinate synthase [Kiritimatiellia bacterium]
MKVKVDLGARSYDIIIGTALLPSLPDKLNEYALNASSGLVVTDSHVQTLYGDSVIRQFQAIGLPFHLSVIPAGEESKSGECLFKIYNDAISAGLERKSIVIALGGGVVGDIAGYAAATYMRGLRFVQAPTTLLAMVDSAVGGKTGINLPQGKNLIGAFHQPSLVLCDLDVLKSLPAREFKAGMAEVIKYGIIYDESLFAFLEANMASILKGDREMLQHIVAQSCRIKAEVVRQDEHETGLRAILNFGHTMGHAIEAAAGYGVYLHGEAISVGMLFAARVSAKVSGLANDEVSRIEALLIKAGLPTKAPDLDWGVLQAAMSLDKKSSKGAPRFVLAEKIGKVTHGNAIEFPLLKEIWQSK